MTLDDATRAQNRAARPTVSTWLSANAGSGKTRVLTDRVARLLLGRTDPQNILCLTYTKAAAGEMQNRLFKGLGAWAMLPDDELRDALAKIGEEPPDDLSRARTLFARAVETPGGLKIQTIHSFCASLLRQFPLEAGVAPGFRELDETGQADLVASVLDQLASDGLPSVADISRIFTGEDLSKLCADILSSRGRFRPVRTETGIRDALGLKPGDSRESVIASLSAHLSQPWWPELISVLRQQSPTYQQNATVLAEIDRADPGESGFQSLCRLFLYSDGRGPKIGAYPQVRHKKAFDAVAPYRDALDALMEAVSACLETILAISSARRTAALHAFAADFLTAYEAEKARLGLVDFDDLIDKTGALLSDRSLDWVLYRLDGRIDHILVDEAQDTSPAQWSVIDRLAEEIVSGEGARQGRNRSLFVVGDKKQSIYSFQGADARAFDDMARHFDERMVGALKRAELRHSFRSSPAILDVVDAAMSGADADAVGTDVDHTAFHETLAGRVDLWPLQERATSADPPPWYDPVDRVSEGDPAVVLADKLADAIAEMIENGSIPDGKGGFRPVRAGDFLILVQRRSTLFDQIIRACKARGLPMAGADRLKITATLAVKDLVALLAFLALPEDDLSLAAALKSPLFGWDEKALFSVARERGGKPLWQALRERAAEFPDTIAILDDLRRLADFERPYELLETILGRHEGRRNLIARLGPEAEDGIDELLNQALRYEQATVPSLTGFLSQISADDLSIKRATDSSDNLIRVMTIHGAKGLESPIVILPDTVRSDQSQKPNIVVSEDGFPFWNERKEDAPEAVRAAVARHEKVQADERLRLLYVAMTRAETWLITAGIAPGKASNTPQWHERVEKALLDTGATWIEEGGRKVLRYQTGTWPTEPQDDSSDAESDASEPADGITFGPLPAAVPPLVTVSPSDLGGAKALPGEGGLDEDSAKARGRALHALLELLPQRDPAHWPTIAQRVADAEGIDADPSLLAEARDCIAAHPALFGANSLAEADVTGDLPVLASRLDGTIDRLVFDGDRIIVIDYKTNAVRPERPEDTPDGILRQMGAYLVAVRNIWPDRQVDLIVLWTRGATAMTISHELATNALARAART